MVAGLAFRTILADKKESCNAVFLVGSIIATFLCYSGLLLSHYLGGMNVPMLIVGGPGLSADRVRCFGPIDNTTLQQIADRWRDKATFWPFAYRNLQYSFVTVAMDSLYLSVLVVPDEFVDARLARYVTVGRLPDTSSLECLVGSNAAKAWRIEEGKFVHVELEWTLKFDSSDRKQPGAKSLKVVGVMSDDMNSQFLRGAVILTRSTFETLYQKQPIYNSFFAYPSTAIAPVEELRRYVLEKQLCPYCIRYPLLRGGTPSMMLVVLLFAVAMAFQLSATSSFERNLKNVGILRSLGAGRWQIISIFALADGVVQVMGIAAGVLATKYVFLLLNLAVMHNAPQVFSTYATHFRLHQSSVGIVAAFLVLSAAVRAGRTVWCLSRLSPDSLIHRATT